MAAAVSLETLEALATASQTSQTSHQSSAQRASRQVEGRRRSSPARATESLVLVYHNHSDHADTLHTHLRDLARIPRLPDAEQDRLLRLVHANVVTVAKAKGASPRDGKARTVRTVRGRVAQQALDTLWQHNLRLVPGVARWYVEAYGSRGGLTYLDALQEASIGVREAILQFNPALGIRFSTYAVWWVRQAVSRAVDTQSTLVRIPCGLSSKLRAWRRVSGQVEEQLGRPARDDEVALALGWSVARVASVRQLAEAHLEQITSLDSPPARAHAPRTVRGMQVGGDDDLAALGDLLEDEDPARLHPERLGLLQVEARDEVARLVAGAGLSGREGAVLLLRYGFAHRHGVACDQIHTLGEAGRILGVTREAVRQLQVRALVKLREAVGRLETGAQAGEQSGKPAQTWDVLLRRLRAGATPAGWVE